MVQHGRRVKQLSTGETVRRTEGTENELDEEQDDGREQSFIKTRISYETALTYVEGLIVYLEHEDS